MQSLASSVWYGTSESTSISDSQCNFSQMSTHLIPTMATKTDQQQTHGSSQNPSARYDREKSLKWDFDCGFHQRFWVLVVSLSNSSLFQYRNPFFMLSLALHNNGTCYSPLVEDRYSRMASKHGSRSLCLPKNQ